MTKDDFDFLINAADELFRYIDKDECRALFGKSREECVQRVWRISDAEEKNAAISN